jgi:hypothetical protein
VEWVNRTLRDKFFRYLTYKNTYRYLDVLPKFVQVYNFTVLTTTGMAPVKLGDTDVLSICNMAGGNRVARVYLGKQYMECKLHELRYLRYIFFMVRNQLTFYMAALNDVIAYVNSAQSSNTFARPPATAHKSINYFQLFEELKAIL